jgi:hypothetical protein
MLSKPALIAVSSMLEIHKRLNGFLHPARSYTKRQIRSPSRPASVAQTRFATSLRFIKERKIVTVQLPTFITEKAWSKSRKICLFLPVENGITN